MYNSIAAGRRLAVQVVAAQSVAAIITGLLFLLQGIASATAAWCGGALVVVGTAVLALRVFAPPLAAGGATLRRFAVGVLLKWMVVLAGFYLVLVRLRLPPLPALTGFGAALLVNFLALKFER
ncbi:MAG: ATP synthase subunit I [Proteobacteria bacterium]|nr:ATP synthase subunit I [Pseudomonadota bacterium]